MSRTDGLGVRSTSINERTASAEKGQRVLLGNGGVDVVAWAESTAV